MPSAFFRANLCEPIAAAFTVAQGHGLVPQGRSAFIRQAVTQHIQFARPVVSVRVLGATLGGKTVPASAFSLPPGVLKHWKRYAKAAGDHTIGALVNCALAHAFALTSAELAGRPLADAKTMPCSLVVGRGALAPRLKVTDVGETVVFQTCVTRRRTHEIIADAQAVAARTIPGFAVTARTLPRRRIEITRTS